MAISFIVEHSVCCRIERAWPDIWDLKEILGGRKTNREAVIDCPREEAHVLDTRIHVPRRELAGEEAQVWTVCRLLHVHLHVDAETIACSSSQRAVCRPWTTTVPLTGSVMITLMEPPRFPTTLQLPRQVPGLHKVEVGYSQVEAVWG